MQSTTRFRILGAVGGLVLTAILLALIFVIDPPESITPQTTELWAAVNPAETQALTSTGVIWELLVAGLIVGLIVWDRSKSGRATSELMGNGERRAIASAFVAGVVCCSSVAPWVVVRFTLSITAYDEALIRPAATGISTINAIQIAGLAAMCLAALAAWARSIALERRHWKRLEALSQRG